MDEEITISGSREITSTGVGEATFAGNGVASSSGVGKAISTGGEDSPEFRGSMSSALSKSSQTSPSQFIVSHSLPINQCHFNCRHLMMLGVHLVL